MILSKEIGMANGHADIFSDAHRCGYPHYLTYVGYSTIYADDADIRIRMAIPSFDDLEEDNVVKLVALGHNQENG